ncbi:serine/threonine-protein kinase D6PKL1-like [Pyrus ussuriensis x Pyrus communis]|uniref:Serine/threonine-protein kinase D6PKL1-like n=1 Tax=Pyrus ussuriensis x Pyrus communis TaxID=2448454 RepID=A0A5N5HZF8_9ROSA|nr:serine/threonine-protein kinase D6PKL1-like [Pyrus ussuriensis x Pyrus communis]
MDPTYTVGPGPTFPQNNQCNQSGKRTRHFLRVLLYSPNLAPMRLLRKLNQGMHFIFSKVKRHMA